MLPHPSLATEEQAESSAGLSWQTRWPSLCCEAVEWQEAYSKFPEFQ
jgi:hypothetical protein